MARIRLGAVGYLNARPLVYGLGHSARFDLRFDIPSKCADLLHGGDIDVGLIPSIEYLRGVPLAIVPDLDLSLAIGSSGFTGAIDDVRIFRSALSTTSVANLHTGSFTPVAPFTMNENDTPLTDRIVPTLFEQRDLCLEQQRILDARRGCAAEFRERGIAEGLLRRFHRGFAQILVCDM